MFHVGWRLPSRSSANILRGDAGGGPQRAQKRPGKGALRHEQIPQNLRLPRARGLKGSHGIGKKTKVEEIYCIN